ncbi:hypothetical protein Poly30_22440 [Planctomycetes bacterium Poly30]|uniref:Zinc-finger domain-containing protein n=1 Tax=Saltatorellus ferox TaxID=2528018 RepID=A0A518ERK8_9BACT|nr:hypothetical protein Poly30_22440 [Planctomycetes bacterium Poly30]
MRDLDSWSKDDFEAALPLYVGGDLDGAEATRVDAWLAAHPEDQKTLAASEAAAGVLARYALASRQRPTPDLWEGIRAELLESHLLESGRGSLGQAEEADTLAPILGGPRWFQRKSVAAAAALLLTGSAGLFLMSRGMSAESSGRAPEGGNAPSMVGTPAGALAAGDTAGGAARMETVGAEGLRASSGESSRTAMMGTDGHPLEVMVAGSQHGPARSRGDVGGAPGKTQRLQRPGPGAERLIDDALNVRIWQFAPLVEPSGMIWQGVDGAQLTSGH